MGNFGSKPPNFQQAGMNYWDDCLPNVGIVIRPRLTRITLDTRFVVWGLYLGVKGMIETNHFMAVDINLRWQGLPVGSIGVYKRTNPQSLSEEDSQQSHNTLQQRAPSNESTFSTSEGLDSEYFNLTASNTPSNAIANLVTRVVTWGEDLAKWDFIMPILEGILTAFSPLPSARLEEPVVVQSAAPYDSARLQVLSVQTPPGPIFARPAAVSLGIRYLASICLLRAHQWAEMGFQIKIDEVLVANGRMSRA